MAVQSGVGSGLVGVDVQTGGRTLPDSRAASRASSSTLAPREVLMMTTPSFILAMVSALMRGAPGAAGAWREMKSDWASSSPSVT